MLSKDDIEHACDTLANRVAEAVDYINLSTQVAMEITIAEYLHLNRELIKVAREVIDAHEVAVVEFASEESDDEDSEDDQYTYGEGDLN